MTGGGWTRRPAVTILALLLAAGGTARGGEGPVQPPADSFAAALETHLRAIRERDLEALLDTITTGEKLILVFPDGTLTDSRAEYVEFHEAWFAAPGWRMEFDVLHVIERPLLSHALLKYRYEDASGDGEPRTSVSYLAVTFAQEDGRWRLVFDQNTPISSGN